VGYNTVADSTGLSSFV